MIQGDVNEAQAAIVNSGASDAVEKATDAAAKGPFNYSSIIMLVGLIVIFYVLIFLPQRKQRKEQQKFMDSLQKGSKVVTAGGIYGVVTEVRENVLLVEIDKGVQIKVHKSSVQRDPSVAEAIAKAEKAEKAEK